MDAFTAQEAIDHMNLRSLKHFLHGLLASHPEIVLPKLDAFTADETIENTVDVTLSREVFLPPPKKVAFAEDSEATVTSTTDSWQPIQSSYSREISGVYHSPSEWSGKGRRASIFTIENPHNLDEISFNDLSIGPNVLGKGGYGDVYPALYRGTKVAVKQVRGVDPKHVPAFVSEVKLLSSLHHRNVLLFAGACINPDYPLCIVTALMEGGNLDPTLPLPLHTKLRALNDIVNGLTYLHGKGIVHRDIKPNNILASKEFDHFCIADFGISFYEAEAPRSIGGTRSYMAPEVKRGKPADSSSDIYSFGHLMCELLVGEFIIRPADTPRGEGGERKDFICEQYGQRICAEYGEEIWKICCRCISNNCYDRPTASELSMLLTEIRVTQLMCETLRNYRGFRTSPNDIFMGVVRRAKMKIFGKGHMVIRQNDVDRSMYIVVDGELDILQNGKKVHTIREGAEFGEIAFFYGGKRTADVVCASVTVVLLELNRADFDDMEEREAFMNFFATQASQRMRLNLNDEGFLSDIRRKAWRPRRSSVMSLPDPRRHVSLPPEGFADQKLLELSPADFRKKAIPNYLVSSGRSQGSATIGMGGKRSIGAWQSKFGKTRGKAPETAEKMGCGDCEAEALSQQLKDGHLLHHPPHPGDHSHPPGGEDLDAIEE